MAETFDAIVIGQGAMGSAAAYYLARRRQRVLALEQFGLDHQRGSSYGHSRIIRYSYHHPAYVSLARDTFPLWRAVEDELGEQLYVKTGGVDFGPEDDPILRQTIAAVRDGGIEHELLGSDEASRRFPQFSFPDGADVLYQPDSGFVKASKGVLGHVKLARRYGAAVKEHTPVNAIRLGKSSVDVETAAGSYSTARLILTAGAWTRRILLEQGIDLPLATLRCQLNFMAPPEPSDYAAERCPVWIAHVRTTHRESVYGIPAHDGSGFKIAFHGGSAHDHPSQVDYAPDETDITELRDFMRRYIPRLAEAPAVESRICLYTQTPDEDFIVDALPTHAHVVIGAGFSGHGFKFSTTIGKMLSDLALDGATPHDDSLFKIGRFLD